MQKENGDVVVCNFDVTKSNPTYFSGSSDLAVVTDIKVSVSSDSESDGADSDSESSWSEATTLQFQMDQEGEGDVFNLEVQASPDINADKLSPEERLRQLRRFRIQSQNMDKNLNQRGCQCFIGS